jgi:sRNA-binding regulator protein Hfq
MIEPGKHVKYFLRNGMVLEGIVEKDSASEAILKSLDGKNLMILHRPTEDILMTKIVLTEEASEPAPVPPQEYKEPPPTDHVSFHDWATSKLREIQQAEGNPELMQKSITELRDMVREQDRKIIAQKRKEHFGDPGNAKMTEYSSPYSPMRTVGRRVVPGRIPHRAYGRPPIKGK